MPGDPIAVGDEVKHYKLVAEGISDQVRRLRALAVPDAALQGHYADELRSGMDELADDLDKAHHRFATAGSQLALLEPALEIARTITKTQLDGRPRRTSRTRAMRRTRRVRSRSPMRRRPSTRP